MKVLVIALSVLTVIALVQSKAISEEIQPVAEEVQELAEEIQPSAEEIQPLAEGEAVRVQEFLETIAVTMESGVERQAVQEFEVPLISRACDNLTCQRVCNFLHFSKGRCTSATTCLCSN